jgi:hypothetical protein|tara:strand:+ start:725 stop:1891 length:1167 start_codon:yes stop_codon:yes gene_type:complete
MAHNDWHTAGQAIAGTASNAWDWFNDPAQGGLRNMMGAAGQLAAAKQASNRMEGLSEKAVTRIGMPTGSFYDTIKADTKFTPFSVTTGTAGPGSVTTDATGSSFYAMNDNQKALSNSLRNGGTDFLNSSLGQGAYGRPQLDAAGNQLQDAAGNPLFEDDAGYNLEQYIGGNRSLTDPFDTSNLTTREDALYKQIQTMRQPGQVRDQLALDAKLFAQGRTGLQTSAYGGSPEQFAMEQAKLEQSGQDQLMAMQQARVDAANISDRRQMGIGEARQDRALSGDMAGAFLDASYQPTRELIGAMQPSLNMADMATTAGRQLGGYGRDLATQELDYDLGTEQMSADIQREALNSIFGMLMNEQTNRGNVAASSSESNQDNFLEQYLRSITAG